MRYHPNLVNPFTMSRVLTLFLIALSLPVPWTYRYRPSPWWFRKLFKTGHVLWNTRNYKDAGPCSIRSKQHPVSKFKGSETRDEERDKRERNDPIWTVFESTRVRYPLSSKKSLSGSGFGYVLAPTIDPVIGKLVCIEFRILVCLVQGKHAGFGLESESRPSPATGIRHGVSETFGFLETSGLE